MTINDKIALICENIENDIHVVVWNIANAKRDNLLNPLIRRCDFIIQTIKKMQVEQSGIDVLVLLEANRASTDSNGQVHSFTSIANRIENETGLVYLGIDIMNASGMMSFGKAIFIDINRVYVNKLGQKWASETPDICSGPYLGSSITHLRIWPVSDAKCVINKHFDLGVLHFPMALQDRMEVVKFLQTQLKFDLIMGDFNTFPDDGGPEIIDLLSQRGYQNCLPLDCLRTFHAFPHDLLKINGTELHRLEKLKQSLFIKKNDDGSVVLRPVSWLDQCMRNTESRLLTKCSAQVIDISVNDHDAPSDHFPIFASCSFF